MSLPLALLSHMLLCIFVLLCFKFLSVGPELRPGGAKAHVLSALVLGGCWVVMGSVPAGVF